LRQPAVPVAPATTAGSISTAADRAGQARLGGRLPKADPPPHTTSRTADLRRSSSAFHSGSFSALIGPQVVRGDGLRTRFPYYSSAKAPLRSNTDGRRVMRRRSAMIAPSQYGGDPACRPRGAVRPSCDAAIAVSPPYIGSRMAPLAIGSQFAPRLSRSELAEVLLAAISTTPARTSPPPRASAIPWSEGDLVYLHAVRVALNKAQAGAFDEYGLLILSADKVIRRAGRRRHRLSFQAFSRPTRQRVTRLPPEGLRRRVVWLSWPATKPGRPSMRGRSPTPVRRSALVYVG